MVVGGPRVNPTSETEANGAQGFPMKEKGMKLRIAVKGFALWKNEKNKRVSCRLPVVPRDDRSSGSPSTTTVRVLNYRQCQQVKILA
jgi:hypothetical protein